MPFVFLRQQITNELDSRAHYCSVYYILKCEQHNRSVATSGLPAGYNLGWAAIILAAGSIATKAQDAPGTTSSQLPDKSRYNLFDPTPGEFMREMSADRPDKTDCPFTVDAGHFQVEMDFANFSYDAPNSEHGNVKSENYQIAPMNLKVGVLNNMDFQLVLMPCQRERTKDNSAGTVEEKSGFGDITPRVKVNFIGNDGGFFALALIPFVKLPTSQNRLGNDSVEGGLGIPYAFDVPNWDVGLQTTFSFDRNEVGNGYHAEFGNSVSIGHAVIGKLSCSAEAIDRSLK